MEEETAQPIAPAPPESAARVSHRRTADRQAPPIAPARTARPAPVSVRSTPDRKARPFAPARRKSAAPFSHRRSRDHQVPLIAAAQVPAAPVIASASRPSAADRLGRSRLLLFRIAGRATVRCGRSLRLHRSRLLRFRFRGHRAARLSRSGLLGFRCAGRRTSRRGRSLRLVRGRLLDLVVGRSRAGRRGRPLSFGHWRLVRGTRRLRGSRSRLGGSPAGLAPPVVLHALLTGGRAARAELPNLVLLDLQLPDELHRRIPSTDRRETGQGQRTPAADRGSGRPTWAAPQAPTGR